MAIGPLFGLARSAAEDADFASALTLSAAARRAAGSSDTNWAEALNHQFESIVNAERSSRNALREAVATAAWERGTGMDIRAAYEFTRSSMRSSARPLLSSREREVARMVAGGLTDKEIALRLSLSRRTVEVHLAHVRRKLGLRNRAEVAVWAISGAANE
jgi:non-specific serine/threonine protein kinase